MRHNIIHIFLPMLIGLACAASCTSERDPQDSRPTEEMTFEVGDLTRASITTNENLKNKPFMLFGDVNRTGEYDPGLKEIFKGQTVTFQNNKWDYGPARYWFMGQEHSFVALHPASIQEIPGGITYSNSRISFTYETPLNDYKGTTDILVATHRRRTYTLDNGGTVRFGFKHVLSRINIAPALDEKALMYEDEDELDKHPDNKNEYIQLVKVELYGIKTRASFSFASAPLSTGEYQTDERIETYEVDEESAKPIVLNFINTPQITNNKVYVNAFDDAHALLMLPQHIGEGAKAVLYYTVNGDNTVDQPIRTVTIPLSDLSIKKWDVGKIYTYKFVIEKVYTGQIKAGSLKWTVEDSNIADPNAKDKWISEDDIIEQKFDLDDDQ